jgi:hypothetical protein
MNRRFAIAALIGATLFVTGCASGPKFDEVEQSIPTLAADEGRVYFFRSNSFAGAAAQSTIYLNDVAVGASKPGGFFYVDRPAGSYAASTQTEAKKSLTFTLEAGETKYIRTSPSFGFFIGRVALDLEDSQTAQAEIKGLSYIGDKLDSGQK